MSAVIPRSGPGVGSSSCQLIAGYGASAIQSAAGRPVHACWLAALQQVLVEGSKIAELPQKNYCRVTGVSNQPLQL